MKTLLHYLQSIFEKRCTEHLRDYYSPEGKRRGMPTSLQFAVDSWIEFKLRACIKILRKIHEKLGIRKKIR